MLFSYSDIGVNYEYYAKRIPQGSVITFDFAGVISDFGLVCIFGTILSLCNTFMDFCEQTTTSKLMFICRT